MTKSKAVKGFNLSVGLIMDLVKLKNARSINLSVWVEKVLQQAVTAELKEIKKDEK